MNQKKQMLQLCKKWIGKGVLILFLFACLSSCQSPLDADRKVYSDQILSATQTLVRTEDVHVVKEDEIKVLHQEEESFMPISPSNWGEQKGFFSRFIVWPLAMLLEVLSQVGDAGFAVLLFGVLQEVLLALFQFRSHQNAWTKRKIDTLLQEQIQAIEDLPLYQRKTLFQEAKTTNYCRHHVKESSGILIKVLPYVLMFGMVYAVYRSASVISGSFVGVPLVLSPLQCLQTGEWTGVVLYFVLLLVVGFTTLYPILQMIHLQRKSGVKIGQVQSISGMAKNAYRMAQIVLSLTVLAVAFLYLNWPIAMALYWLVRTLCSFASSRLQQWQEKQWEQNIILDVSLPSDSMDEEPEILQAEQATLAHENRKEKNNA